VSTQTNGYRDLGTINTITEQSDVG
jgi:hypothetical protein